MKRWILWTSIVVVLILLTAVFSFRPLYEVKETNCFYCGRRMTETKILTVPVRLLEGESIYRDGMQIPVHEHRMTELCGYYFDLPRTSVHWDSFGWESMFCRQALVEGVDNYPERRAEIMAEYLKLNPDNDEEIQRFIGRYGKK